MKRTSLSLALIAVAGTASAQSSVTLFGIVDTGVSFYSSKSDYYNRVPGTAPLITPPSVTASQAVLSSGNYVPSRIGVRGQEDLGGGLAASFWLESPMAVDSGATPVSFVRRSTVSLSGVWGELRLGRDITPIFWTDTIYDPFLNSGSGANLIGNINGRIATVSAAPGGDTIVPAYGGPQNYPYSSNTVGYFTPPTLAGFYGQLMYSFPEGVGSTLVPNSPSQRGGLYGARAGYTRGNFDVSGTYEVNTAIDAVAPFTSPLLDTKITTANLGASYDFGFAKLMGEVSHATSDSNAAIAFPRAPLGVAIASTSANYNGVMAGFNIPFGASAIRASYGYVKYTNDATTALASNQDASASKFSIGYTYNLSKRTVLYATAAYVRINDGQNNPAIMGTPAAATGTAFVISGTTSGYAPRSATGYDFGISHNF